MITPSSRAIYLIWTPSWTYKSSGVRVLHLLCHELNERGEKAYLIPSDAVFVRHPHLNTPHGLDLTNNWPEFHNSGIDYIVIYPDVVTGNPLKAKKVVRYLLAPRGLYGGSKEFPATDKVYGYTKDLADKVLFLPPYDEGVFYPPPDGSPRAGEVFYSHKYDKIHRNTLPPVTDAHWKRLEGTPQELAGMLRAAEICYMFERSEVGILARMCGCKVVNIVSDYWDGKDPDEAVDPEGNLRAIDWAVFYEQLAAFIEETQTWR